MSPTVPSFPRDSPSRALLISWLRGKWYLLLFSVPPIPPPEGPNMRSWCLVAIGRDEFYSALGPFRIIYLCENPEIHKIFSLHQKNIFTRASYHTLAELQSGHQVSSALRYQVTSSHLKSKREKKGFGFGRVKIAFATSHERIIEMDNDNNHMQEKVTNTYMHIFIGAKYGLVLDSGRWGKAAAMGWIYG